METDWFKSWFNTKYYHILYKNRNEEEAERFLTKLIDYLKPDASAKFIDIACGKGRHARFIHQMGFETVGYDLSEQSIINAQAYENERLKFYVHDMRQIFRTNYFDFALNLFTSFGYFKTSRDEQNAMLSASKNLKKNGVLVVDFLNADYVTKTLIPYEEKNIDGILFKISKKIENKHVIKTIAFNAEGNDFEFKESVKLLTQQDFESYFAKANLELVDIFNNYQLSKSADINDRLILIAKKIG